MNIRTFFILTLWCVGSFARPTAIKNGSDSGVTPTPYSEIIGTLEKLARNNPGYVRLETYGMSQEGRPLVMAILQDKKKSGKHDTVLISGGIHGNEYLNLEHLLPNEFLKRSKTNSPFKKFLDEGGAFVFVPVQNPDGIIHRTRENSRGVDLNRDWDLPSAKFSGFTEPETKSLSSKLESMTRGSDSYRYRVAMDYHCCAKALLHPWSFKDFSVPPAIKSHFKTVGELAQRFLGVSFGTTPTILGYQPLGTNKDYYFTRYQALAFTYEGRFRDEHALLEQHVDWWEAMLLNLEPKKTALWQPAPEAIIYSKSTISAD